VGEEKKVDQATFFAKKNCGMGSLKWGNLRCGHFKKGGLGEKGKVETNVRCM